jgi:hypothetical protein
MLGGFLSSSCTVIQEIQGVEQSFVCLHRFLTRGRREEGKSNIEHKQT